MQIVLEKTNYQKKYKCPYCDKRDTRQNLVSHIADDHEDMIPKDYTPLRVVFNTVNKKDHGNCIICKGETKWDENKGRYDRLCGKKSCHDKYVKMAHANTRIEERMRDPEFQQKMLAGRSISGEYKFSDGGRVSYVGSYEKNLLEFMDKDTNKGSGLKIACDILGIPVKSSMAFGDTTNDYSLIETAGIGVCMINGTDDVKEVADHITKYTNNEDGFYHFIQENVFKKTF